MVITSTAGVLYSVPVIVFRAVDIEADGPVVISNATMQRVIAFAAWEASIVRLSSLHARCCDCFYGS
ncbi:unnamed protein product [Gongylonema pulchrum]|uniref:Secreted protein n=1 Tax=Gongylonema pulchrum TaxID=637853 RepID=A0A183E7C2_9BILA|nr:unnamed protein product [Gongylonema pulchrum]